MNRGLAAALLLCQNKGVGSGWEPWQCGYYSREGLDGCLWVLHGVPLSLSALSTSLDLEPLTAVLCCRVGGLFPFCAFKALST